MKTTLLQNLGLAIAVFAAINSSIIAQSVIDNDIIRIGHGAETSINNHGNMQQPFFQNNNIAYKLTYSTYALNEAFAVGGDGTDHWNLSGTVLTDPLMSNQVLDMSGFTYTSGSSGPGTGTIVSTGEITVDGKELQIQKTYELLPDNSFIRIKVKVTNQGNTSADNLRVWIGTKDDWIGTTDGPLKERGNLVNGEFQILTNATDQSNAVRITTNNEGVLFYTDTDKAHGIIEFCCSFNNITSQDPATADISHSYDGSYGFYARMNDLSAGESDEFYWYYAAGEIDELDEITNQITQGSEVVGEAVNDVTCSTASFSGSSTQSGTGYYIVTDAIANDPTAEEIKAGLDYGSTAVVNSGNAEVIGGNEHVFELSELAHSSDYTVFYVVEDLSNQFSGITSVDFSSGTPPVVSFDIEPATSCGSEADGSALASVNGGTAPYTYNWADGETTAQITGRAAGEFNLNVTDNGGCPVIETTATIGLNDQTPPTVITKNATVYIGEDGNATIDAEMVNDQSADDCGLLSFSLSQSEFSCENTSSQDGVNVILTATDESGNFASASAFVTVADTIRPKVFTQDLIIALDVAGNGEISPDMADAGTIDNCSISELSLSKTAFTCADLGVNEVILTAFDGAGNSDEAAFTVRIIDEIAPSATFAENATVYLDNQGFAVPTDDELIAQTSDNCSVVSVTFDIESFSCSDIGLRGINATVVDSDGNTSIMSGQVLVSDTIKPLLSIATIELESDMSGSASLNPETLLPFASDACGIDEILLDSESFTCTDSGTETSVTVVDGNGNVQVFSLEIIIIDNTPPVLTAEGTTVALHEDGRFNLTSEILNVKASDDCSDVDIAFSKTRVTCADLGFVPVTITATDNSGNESQYTVMIEVVDDMAPVINVENKVYLCVGTPYDYADFVSGSDNCEFTLTQITGPVLGSQLEPGTYMARFKAVDSSGNITFNGCSIEVLEYPEVDLGEDVTVPAGSLVGITAGTDSDLIYQWSTGHDTPYAELYVLEDMTVSVAVSNLGGCTSYDEINLFAQTTMEANSGDDDGNSFRIYPNPAVNQINLSFGLNETIDDAMIHIMDVQGKVVGIQRIAQMKNGQTHSLNVNHLSQGLYIVTISNGNVKMTTKFSKQ